MTHKLELVSPDRPESDEMFTSDEFVECDTCRALPGSPTLCFGCLSNRHLIGRQKMMLAASKMKPLSVQRLGEIFKEMCRRAK